MAERARAEHGGAAHGSVEAGAAGGPAGVLAAFRRVRDGLMGTALADPAVTDILCNPPRPGETACALWLRRAGNMAPAGALDPAAVSLFLGYAAGLAGKELRPDCPRLDTVLPDGGARLHADIPPVTRGPGFALRKPYAGRVRLEDWLAQGAATPAQVAALRAALADGHTSVVIAGATGCGKTTLLRACLEEPALMAGRPVLLQDTYEFACPCPNAYEMTADPAAGVTLERLVADALRLAPTHIVLGEVRRGEAQQMIVAWNTGHAGLCTVHATSAADALDRIAQMVGLAVPRIDALQLRWIAKAVQVLVFLREEDGRRRITDLLKVEGYSPQDGFQLRSLTS